MIPAMNCPWCGQFSTQYLQVNGHYQCPVCRRSVMDCCDGETNNQTGESVNHSNTND